MSSELATNDSKQGTFVKRSAKTWIHPDNAMQEGVIYNVKYVGCIGVNESMKSLSFEFRTLVARESIRRVAEKTKVLNLPRKIKKNDEQLTRILSNNINTQWSNNNVELHVNTQSLRIINTETSETLFQHTMQNISFACGGDAEIQDFVAYVAKDDYNGRACYVFECVNGLANNVITTIGQAFELRFKKYLNSIPGNTKSELSDTPVSSNGALSSATPKSQVLKEHQSNHNGQHLQKSLHHHSSGGGSSSATTPTHNNSKGIILNEKIEIPSKRFNPIDKQQPLHIGGPMASAYSHESNQNIHHIQHKQQPLLNNNPIATPIITPSSSVHKIDEKLEKMPWFHHLMARENAEKLLTKDGDYLVRETNKANRQYVLSGRYKGECRHIFLVDPSGVVRTKDRVFENICHLIKYHQENNIPIISKDNELLLENPISCR